MPTYTPNIPQPTDIPANSQDQILKNFQQLNAANDVNHTFLNSASFGKHYLLQFPLEQAAAPSTAVNEVAFYTKQGPGAVTQFYMRGENSGSEYQISSIAAGVDPQIASFGTTAGVNSSGWTFLPGNLFLQYGIRSIAATGTATTITFPKSFGAIPYSITIGNITNEGNSPGSNNQFVKEGTVSATQFDVVNSSSSSSRKIYWMAIGPRT